MRRGRWIGRETRRRDAGTGWRDGRTHRKDGGIYEGLIGGRVMRLAHLLVIVSGCMLFDIDDI